MKAMKHTNRMMPSKREIRASFRMVIPTSIPPANTQMGTSTYTFRLVQKTGAMMAVNPMMAKALKILLPTTLPIAISVLPSMADIRLTTNSGALVPAATMVKPITNEEMLKRRAMLDAPSVSQSAPFTISTRPTTNKAANFNPSI